MESLIEINFLQRSFDGETVLKGLNGVIKKGDVIALLGMNGAGKSTFLNTLSGFGVPSFGGVTLWGKNATEMQGDHRQKLGFVPQVDELIDRLTALDHCALFQGVFTNWDQKFAEKLLFDWNVPQDQPVGKLSIGQRQKVSIILALAYHPELLILDEPVAGLDPVARRQFLQQLIELTMDSTRSIIFSTHIVSDVERIANKVWILREGDFVYQGEMDELKESVVRLTLPEQADTNKLPVPLEVVSKNRVGNEMKYVVKGWSEEQVSNFKPLMVESLSLEDIFLEFNK